MRDLIDRVTIDGYAESRRREFEDQLRTLVEIPSVSMEPDRKADVRRCAEAAAELLKSSGASAEIAKTKGNPVVLGQFHAGRGLPTITIYNHLDVQPGDGPEWTRPAFEMAIEGDRYYARGATDDKGPLLTALFAARFAHERGVPLNIRFLWELEEEIGSPNFEEFLARKARSIQTDSVVVSDTIWIARGKPVVSAGLRGLQGALLRLRTGAKDCHSGLTGGAARNPIAELAAVISGCVDARTGRVKLEGFHADVVKPTAAELRSFRDCGFTVAGFKKAHGLRSLRQTDPMQVMQAIWARPTFEVHGIAGGYQGPGVKTIVPPFAEAKVSMRLVPNQQPKKILRLLQRHVRQLNRDVEVIAEGSLAPYRGVTEGRYAEAAAAALKFAFGKTPAFVREGGSIGAVVSMQQRLKCPVHFIGLSLPEHGYHAPNEYYDWGQASGGIAAFVRYFDLLAAP